LLVSFFNSFFRKEDNEKKNLKILLASPRGFCAGVDRAIEM
jgi:Penicillin tolerance protein